MTAPQSLSLFPVETRGRTRANGASTSAQAASGISGRTEAAVLELFSEDRDWSADECAWVLEARGFYGPTVVSAFSRLKDCQIVATGETRKSRRGRYADVYCLAVVPQGVQG